MSLHFSTQKVVHQSITIDPSLDGVLTITYATCEQLRCNMADDVIVKPPDDDQNPPISYPEETNLEELSEAEPNSSSIDQEDRSYSPDNVGALSESTSEGESVSSSRAENVPTPTHQQQQLYDEDPGPGLQFHSLQKEHRRQDEEQQRRRQQQQDERDREVQSRLLDIQQQRSEREKQGKL